MCYNVLSQLNIFIYNRRTSYYDKMQRTVIFMGKIERNCLRYNFFDRKEKKFYKDFTNYPKEIK